MVSSLFGLLTKNLIFCWIDNYQKTFEEMKDKLTIALILRDPNWALPFHIHIDAS